MSGFQLPFGIKPVNAVPVDYYSGPYISNNTIQDAIDYANATIPQGIRFKTMEVRLLVNGIGLKYWYKDGITNDDLIEFSTTLQQVTAAGNESTTPIIVTHPTIDQKTIQGSDYFNFINAGGSNRYVRADLVLDNTVFQLPNKIGDQIFAMQSDLTGLGGGGAIEKTYAELVALQTDSTLIEGQVYLLTDYETTYTQPVTGVSKYSGVIEHLYLKAVSVNTLHTECLSGLYPQDIIYYSLLDDSEGFTKGKIYRRIDTLRNNDIGTDWRHVKYDRSGVDKLLFEDYTNCFNNVIKTYYLIDSVIGDSFNSNTISDGFNSNTIGKNFNTNAIGDSFQSNTIGNSFQSNTIGDAIYSNTIGEGFISNTIGKSFYSNTIGDGFQSNTIGDGFTSNTIGIGFNSNIIGISFNSNIIENVFQSNTIENVFYSNTISYGFRLNTIGNGFIKNTIGDTFNLNAIGEGFQSNTIGNNFNSNTIGNVFYLNTISDSFQSNTIGNSFQSNTIGYGFNSNPIGDSFQSNTIGDSFQSNTIEIGFQSNTIGDSFQSNTIENGFISNTIGYDFNSNTIGVNFYSNTIGDGFQSNTIGDGFNSNPIGDGFNSNNIGNGFQSNTIGNGFNSNTISNGFNSNTIGNYFYLNTIGDNFQSNAIGSDFVNIILSDLELYNKIYPHFLYKLPNGTFQYKWVDDFGDTNINLL